MAGKLNWDDARIFLAVVHGDGLAAASRSLGLDETTCGRRLRRLEADLGCRLFDRLANRLSLTAEGEAFLPAAEAMAVAAGIFSRRARPVQQRERVRITATNSVALFVAQHVAAVLAAAPMAIVELVPTRSVVSLATRDAEIALRNRRVPERGDLRTRRLGTIAFAPYAANVLAPDGPDAGIPDGLPLIGMSLPERAASQAAWIERHGPERVALRLPDLALRHGAARDGLGAALLPCFLGDADPGLVRLLPPPMELMEDVHLLVHEDLRRLPAVEAVSAALVAIFTGGAAALTGGRRS